jgi:dienelactone hydrolase
VSDVKLVKYTSHNSSTVIQSYLGLPNLIDSRPVVIVLRGVAGGDEGYIEIADRISSWGYVTLVHGWNCRGTNPSDETMHKDFKGAIEFLRTIASARLDAVAIVGFCKGSIYAFAAASTYSFIKAVLVFHGFAFRNLDETHRVQPFDLVNRIESPVLLIHGKDDMTAPLSGMRALDARFAFLRKSCVLRELPNAGHGFSVSTHPNFNSISASQSFSIAKEFLNNCMN